MLFNILIATSAIMLLSLTGVFFFGKKGHLLGTNRFVIPFAIGVFLGVVFFELIPETLESGGEYGSISIVVGFIAFYLLSHLLHTYHHHHNTECDGCAHDGCEDKTGASMLLVGDAIHNIADGIVIATAFLVNPAVGIATTLGIAFHEIPQEIAEFGVLLRAGYSRTRAAMLNLLSASSIILGALLTLAFAEMLNGYVWILTGLAAGNLLYIAASDLLPDVHAESRRNGQVVGTFMATVLGVISIALLLSWVHTKFDTHHDEHEERHIAEDLVSTNTDSHANESEQRADETTDALFDGEPISI